MSTEHTGAVRPCHSSAQHPAMAPRPAAESHDHPNCPPKPTTDCALLLPVLGPSQGSLPVCSGLPSCFPHHAGINVPQPIPHVPTQLPKPAYGYISTNGEKTEGGRERSPCCSGQWWGRGGRRVTVFLQRVTYQEDSVDFNVSRHLDNVL